MGKGRDTALIKKRDEALLRRYYFWTEIQRLRFDDALTILSEQEFFISQERILRIIRHAIKTPKECAAVAIPVNKTPHLTYKQLSLFSDGDLSIESVHRENRSKR